MGQSLVLEYLLWDEGDDCLREDTLLSEYDLIFLANDYYDYHFSDTEFYDEGFRIKNVKQAIEFWECNGYRVFKMKRTNRRK